MFCNVDRRYASLCWGEILRFDNGLRNTCCCLPFTFVTERYKKDQTRFLCILKHLLGPQGAIEPDPEWRGYQPLPSGSVDFNV